MTTSDITHTGIIALAAILHATVQLGLGCLILLYQGSSSRHITKKTKSLISNFVSGIGIIIFFLLAATCFIAQTLLGAPLSTAVLSIAVGVLIATAIVMWFFYYRGGRTTELWLPASVARFTTRRARSTDTDTEAFSLGVFCSFAELPIIATPLLIAANSILSVTFEYQLILLAIYVIVAISPLIILRLAIRTGRTAVDIQKWRLRNKSFLRLISGIAFLVLAAFILAFEVL